MLTVRAHAKLTLSFELLGRREDGYHEVVGVLQSIDLADTLTASPATAVHLRCNTPGLSGPTNLAWQAADLLRREAAVPFGALLELEKTIPIAAGLGGGSVDAAAALVLLNRFWELDWPVDRLQPIAQQLGSDVPFALRGGTALATGRGDEIEPLPLLGETWFVLVRPPYLIADKTKHLYSLLGREHYSDGRRTHVLAAALAWNETIEPSLLGNVFDAVAEKAYPGIDAYRTMLRELGAETVHLCGAGPTLFSWAPNREVAQAWAATLQGEGHEAYAVASTNLSVVFQQ